MAVLGYPTTRTECLNTQSPQLVSPKASSRRSAGEGTIVAPTPLYKLPYRLEEEEETTVCESEIEQILAEKGKTAENVIRPFPRITSCDDVAGGMLRVESLVDIGFGGMNRVTSSPVLRTRLQAGDEVPSDFPIAVSGGKSYLDLSALDDSSSNAYGSSTMLDLLDDSFVEPPTRSSNPLKSLLSSPSATGKSSRFKTPTCAWSSVSQREVYGAELHLNSLSPAFA